MYGYFRPYEVGMQNKTQHVFHAYYCRTCYCLWQRGGQRARVLTTFDITLYTIILHLATNRAAPREFPCQRIRTTNKRYFSQDDLGLRIADLGLIVAGEKIRDDLLDGNRVKAHVADLFYRARVRAACRRESELARIARKGTDLINTLQNEHASLDAVLDGYADMMADGFALFGPLEERYLRVYRAMARWTFFVDMVADYDEDVAKGQNNSLIVDDSPTIADYFSRHYGFLYEKNRAIACELHDAVEAIRADNAEWCILDLVINHALDTVMPDILQGKNVKFQYFHELHKNWRRARQTRAYLKKKEASHE